MDLNRLQPPNVEQAHSTLGFHIRHSVDCASSGPGKPVAFGARSNRRADPRRVTRQSTANNSRCNRTPDTDTHLSLESMQRWASRDRYPRCTQTTAAPNPNLHRCPDIATCFCWAGRQHILGKLKWSSCWSLTWSLSSDARTADSGCIRQVTYTSQLARLRNHRNCRSIHRRPVRPTTRRTCRLPSTGSPRRSWSSCCWSSCCCWCCHRAAWSSCCWSYWRGSCTATAIDCRPIHRCTKMNRENPSTRMCRHNYLRSWRRCLSSNTSRCRSQDIPTCTIRCRLRWL